MKKLNDRNAKQDIDKLVHSFFSLFDNTKKKQIHLDLIFDLFIPEGAIIKNVDGTEIYRLNEFIEPRKSLLTDGSLVNFL